MAVSTIRSFVVRARFWLVLALAASCLNVRSVRVTAQVATTEEVKAAFLFNFAKFVEWPPEAWADGAPLAIGVLGGDGIADVLRDMVRGKSIGTHSITVKRINGSEDLATFHLVFIGQNEKSRLPDILRRVERANVLTVSDVDRFCELGGIIALTLEQNHVRFEVSLEAAERAHLKVSSKLLSLARVVYPAKSGTGDR
jgi:hypothetical protein